MPSVWWAFPERNNMVKRKLFVLLTQFPGFDSKALRWWTRFPYSHVSLGLDEDMNTVYSFVVKGFIVEDISRYNKPGRPPFPCELYALEVSESTYQAVKQNLLTFIRKRSKLAYTRLGLILTLINIPWRLKNQYICSQFVAQTLQRCTAVRLKKDSTLYLPEDFPRLKELKMIFKGDLLRLSHRFGKLPYPAV